MLTDPVADLLARIRNGLMARAEKVEVPASRLKASIVKVLRDEGFIHSFRLVREGGKASIKIQLRYDEKGTSVIRGMRRVSRPGLRRYVKCNEVASTRNGTGTAILSTPKGVMTGKTASGVKAGGEYLCEVW